MIKLDKNTYGASDIGIHGFANHNVIMILALIPPPRAQFLPFITYF